MGRRRRVEDIELNDTVVAQILNATMMSSQAAQSSNEQFLVYLIVSSVMSSIIYFFVFGKNIGGFFSWHTKVKPMIKHYMKMTGRNVIIMSHAQTGFFGNMITMSDCIKIESLIRKFGNSKIDLIMNTFGGDLFASIRIANLLKQNPNIRVVVPKYAWSGGSLISIGASKILANPNSIFGACDPQYGNIFKGQFSAKYWDEITKKKGKTAADDSIAMSRMGKELMEEMRKYLGNLIEGRKIDRKMFFDMMLEGKHTHGNMITPMQLKKMGFDVEQINTQIPDRIIESMEDTSGVYGFQLRR